MAEPKKPQKASCSSNRNTSDSTPNPADPKPKSRDKYKSDIPLQSNQTLARMPCNTNSPRTEGDWFESPEKVMKGLGIPHQPEEDKHNNKPQKTDMASA